MGTRALGPGLAGGLAVLLATPLAAQVTQRVNLSSAGAQANDHSDSPAISADGCYVAFGSNATNLVPGDTNFATDVFVRDRTGGPDFTSLYDPGQGVRCVAGTLKRLFTKSAVAGSITAPDFGAGDPTVSARSAAKGDTIGAGESRWYLVFYRDPIVLGGCPGTSTFNATQSGRVTWSP